MSLFMPQELVSRSFYGVHGDDSLRWIDARLVKALEFMRGYFKKPIIVNNWVFKGDAFNPVVDFEWSGLRTSTCENYKVLSCHSFGRAADIKVEGYSAPEVHKVITSNSKLFISNFITGLEASKDTPSWTHISVSNFQSDKLAIIPKDGVIEFI